MPDATSFYLGPTKPRLLARTWHDIVAAAAAGILDETQWAELKQDIPASSKPANRELAKDLASLSVDGGVLVVGVQDARGVAGEVVGTDLTGLADRIAQVATGSISPALSISTTTIPHLTQSGRGILLVTVPASLGAPHMVDGSYWGRGDNGKRTLSDDEVRRLLATRLSRAEGFETRLRALSEDLDPIPAADRRHGHLYLLLEPSAAIPGHPLAEVFAGKQLLQIGLDALTFEPQWVPNLRGLKWTLPHPDGLIGHYHDPHQPIDDEIFTLSALFLDNGIIQIASGAGTVPDGRNIHAETNDGEEVLYGGIVLETAHAAAELASHLSDAYLAYHGPWRIGILIDSLKGRRSSTALRPGFYTRGYRFPTKEYLRVVEATPSQLRETPNHVVAQLIGPLMRSFGDEIYLPYSTPNEIIPRLRRLG